MLAGVGAIMGLPIAQYPTSRRPSVSIRAPSPRIRADAAELGHPGHRTAADRHRRPLYFQSSSSSRGSVTITATFAKGTDPDIAQVQVQNQVQQSVARLPQQVQQQGLVVRKSNPDFLLIAGVYDETNR